MNISWLHEFWRLTFGEIQMRKTWEDYGRNLLLELNVNL
jgi:hypothetical protein